MGRSALLRALQAVRSQHRAFGSTTQACAAHAARPGEVIPELQPYAGPTTVIDVRFIRPDATNCTCSV